VWQAVVTDLNQVARAFVADYDAIQITPNLNGYRELSLAVDPLDDSAAELLVAERAIQVFDSHGGVQFNGQIWEPLERSSGAIKVVARGPLATFSWRRVRAATSYTATNNAGGPWDAGQILADRITIQNGYAPTRLRMGARQASQNRIRSYLPGQREDDVLAELVGAAGGFFFLENPLHGVANYMAEVVALYPAAGVSREDVRFEYGVGTIDNCSDYKVTQSLPRTREVVSSSDATGNRIAGAAEDAAAIARFGLFEDEEAFSDVVDITMLGQQAQGDLRLTPPTTIEMTPGLDAPVLFADFNVGDFVRVKIVHGAFSFWSWARVASATLSVTGDGVEATSAIALELLTGGNPLGDPELAYYDQQDEIRRRLEALERASQVATPPPTASGSSSDPSYTPPPDPGPTPDPAPAPTNPPTINTFTALGFNKQRTQIGGDFTADVNPNGLATDVWFTVAGATSPKQSITSDTVVKQRLGGQPGSTAFTVTCHAKNAAGETTMDANYTTPPANQPTE
jgi:hypothetical protein